MRIKPTARNGGVLVELRHEESQLPSPQTAPVFKLQKILVPLDFSQCSKKALQYAMPFAKQFGAELQLLHVIEPYPAAPDLGPVDLETAQDSQTEIESICRSLGEGVCVGSSIRTGSPHIEIVAAARELSSDLIILSTHGRRGLSRMVLGSTAEKVVRYAPCPVLTVREIEHEFVPAAGTS